VISGVTFDVHRGETVALVGESGCGKTMTAMAILGLLPPGGYVQGGRMLFEGRDLTRCTERERARIRGREIGLVSQEPMVGLNPVFRVGWQIAQAVRQHHGVSRRAAAARAVELLELVRLPEADVVARRYPHELSGGMAQRVAIARALAGDPKLLLADEPTTALDVTVQAEMLTLLRELKEQGDLAVVLVTHDWGVVADIADRAIVMYAGEVVERADLLPMFRRPLHPYTEAMLAANPFHATEGEPLPTIPGTLPALGRWPAGCRFHPRCQYATDECRAGPIILEQAVSGRETRCVHYQQLLDRP
jgi:peptide/nickel transport system permease protein